MESKNGESPGLGYNYQVTIKRMSEKGIAKVIPMPIRKALAKDVGHGDYALPKEQAQGRVADTVEAFRRKFGDEKSRYFGVVEPIDKKNSR